MCLLKLNPVICTAPQVVGPSLGKDRARTERDEARKSARELRLAMEAHEAELIAVAAEYAKKRNNPDNAELEDARRRGESTKYELASPSEAGRPGGLSGVAR